MLLNETAWRLAKVGTRNSGLREFLIGFCHPSSTPPCPSRDCTSVGVRRRCALRTAICGGGRQLKTCPAHSPIHSPHHPAPRTLSASQPDQSRSLQLQSTVVGFYNPLEKRVISATILNSGIRQRHRRFATK